jgi:Uma2 family endonuclease
MAIPQPVKRYTPAEYYELERAADYKSDYYKGEIFAMAGGSRRHSTITSNITGELRQRLKGSPCAVYESNLRLMIKSTGLRTYPDASVYCGKMERDFEDASGETFTNPTVVFEVLSPSTETYDRNTKARSFRQIESLKALVFVAQNEPHVEVSVRTSDGWVLQEYDGLAAVIALPMIGIDLPMSEVYDRVDFSEKEDVA